MSESRLKNSIINVSSGLVYRLVLLLINFISRTVFIRVLGENCLGLDGVFTTLLSMFSLAELGIGQAITFYMYGPIAEKNISKLTVLVQFYKQCYRLVGCAIAVFGILLIPFLPKLINLETDTGYNLIVIYLLYLVNVVVTYLFFSYPQTVLTANQKQYVINHINSIFAVISGVVEISVLCIWRNYINYLIVKIIISIIKNVILAVVSIKRFPYIAKNTKERLSPYEIKKMFKDVYAIFVVKLSSQLFNSTDNLFISAMFGTVFAGYNSNYLMIINAVYGVIGTVIYSFGASVGNLYASETKKKTEQVFSELNFLNCWISCVCTVCLYQLLNPFISLFWSDKYVFSTFAVALMCMNFYMVSSLYTLFDFRQSMGLFKYCIYNQFFAAIINIVLDVVLGKMIGISGLFLATVIANFTVAVFPYAKNLYNVGFEQPCRNYIIKIFKGYVICLLSCVITFLVCKNFPTTLLGFVEMICVCCVVPNMMQFILLRNTDEFKNTVNRVKGLLKHS